MERQHIKVDLHQLQGEKLAQAAKEAKDGQRATMHNTNTSRYLSV